MENGKEADVRRIKFYSLMHASWLADLRVNYRVYKRCMGIQRYVRIRQDSRKRFLIQMLAGMSRKISIQY